MSRVRSVGGHNCLPFRAAVLGMSKDPIWCPKRAGAAIPGGCCGFRVTGRARRGALALPAVVPVA